MAASLTEILQKHSAQLVQQWVDYLHAEVTSDYSGRPIEELIRITTLANEMNYAALAHEDFSKIDPVIDEVCKLWLEGGFSLSEVQWAFELYRTLLTPILAEELQGNALLTALESLNDCLSRTIFALSDYFLKMANAKLTEKQKRLDEDLQAAAAIQRALLPGRVEERLQIGNVEMDWRFMPSERIGGDIFNMIRLDEDHVALYMVDVSGHGVPSALVTFSVSQVLQPHMGHTLRSAPGCSPDHEIVPPSEVLRTLDLEFPWERFEKFLTTIYLIINVRDGHLVYSNAAHPPPILLHADGTFELLEKGGTIIGLGGILPFEEEEKTLSAEDKILLYTDGVFEFTDSNGEIFGQERFHALAKSLNGLGISTMLTEIVGTVESLVQGSRLEDDVSLLGIEFKGKGDSVRE